MKKKTLLSIFAAFLAGTIPSFAAVEFYVATNGDDGNDGSKNSPFATVEQAALSVNDNEETTIYLEKDATFKIGKIDFKENKLVSIIGDNTTLLGADKPGNQGGEANRILRAGKKCTISVKGLNFRNSRQIEYLPGGAIFFIGDKLTVENCRFYDNECGSGGGAIGSRGNVVIVKNCYFEGNYTIGGGSYGGAIMQAGSADASYSSLYVENCTFYKNALTVGGQGTAIATYDPSQNGGQYSTTSRLDVVNCTFVGNTSGYAYQAAVDITGGSECETHLINNTFYDNDGALRLYFQTVPVYMFNNFIYANKAGVLSEWSIADSERTAITGYNNMIYGAERSVNEKIDDPCFQGEAAACNNTLGLANDNPMVNLGVATSLKTNDGFMPYLPIINRNSPLIDAGLDDSSAYTETNEIPATDVRGASKKDKKDIGAFEYGGDAGVATNLASNDAISFIQNAGNIVVASSDNEAIEVAVYTVDGKLALTASGSTVDINKAELPKGLVIVKAAGKAGVATCKAIVK